MFEPALNDNQSRLDRLQLGALCLLMLIGAAFVYSATTANDAGSDVPIV